MELRLDVRPVIHPGRQYKPFGKIISPFIRKHAARSGLYSLARHLFFPNFCRIDHLPHDWPIRLRPRLNLYRQTSSTRTSARSLWTSPNSCGFGG